MIRTFGAHAPRVHPTAFVHDSAEVIGRVSLGPGVSVWPLSVLRGDVHRIAVGEGSNVQDLCALHCDRRHPTIVGRRVTIGHGAILHGCRVGDGCLVGMGAVVLECVVGRESLVGAGSVVPRGLRIPPRSLVLGAPARVARRLSREELGRLRQPAAVYAGLARRHLSASRAVTRA